MSFKTKIKYPKAGLLAVCLSVLSLSGYAQNGHGFNPTNGDYLWPTNASNYMSSTFGETRSAHFHSALDLKTWGRKGYEVYATRDGYVHRIAIGPTGYGKVIYLKHDDGSYSVYAHLLRFEEKIQQLADSIRFTDYRFELDQNLDHLKIPVKKGDVIGLSGASGIGPPHLHFELRNPSNHPFNPLLTNLKVQDQVPPQFSRLSIEPLSMTSKIEGENRIYTKRTWKQNGSYSFGTVDVTGTIGLGVDVFDQADDVYNAYAVYELKMLVNGELRFHSKIDEFSYAETNQMLIDRVYPILKKTRAGFQRLFVADGNTLPFYATLPKGGRLNLEPGTHKVEIIASDFYGNRAEALLQLRVHPQEEQQEESLAHLNNEVADVDVTDWDWFEDWVNIPKNEFSTTTIASLGNADFGGNSKGNFRENGNGSFSIPLDTYRDHFFRKNYQEHFILRRVIPNQATFIPSSTDNSFIKFRPHTFYDSVSIGLIKKQYRADSVSMRVFPDIQPTRKPYRLAVAIDSSQAGMPHLGLYHYDERREKLSFIPSHKKEEFLMADTEELGLFYLLSDTSAPHIEHPRLVRRTDGQWLVYVQVSDDRSGINYGRSEFYVNGTRGIAEYEPEDNRLVYYHPDFEPLPENNLRVVIYDQEGHETEKYFYLSGSR